METLLRGLRGVSVYQDDVLVTGGSTNKDLQNLDVVLSCIENARLCLDRAKCSFLKPHIEYLGHVIDENELHPTDGTIAALKEAPIPKNITQLRSFLGLINYYLKLFPNLSTMLKPLYNLLLKSKHLTRTEQHDMAFKLAKEALQADSVLVHYDSAKPLLLACDVSEPARSLPTQIVYQMIWLKRSYTSLRHPSMLVSSEAGLPKTQCFLECCGIFRQVGQIRSLMRSSSPSSPERLS